MLSGMNEPALDRAFKPKKVSRSTSSSVVRIKRSMGTLDTFSSAPLISR